MNIYCFEVAVVVLAVGLAGRAGWGQIMGVVPEAGAKDVPVNTMLKWKAVEGATGYDVHFGYALPAGAGAPGPDWPPYQCRVTKPEFVLETLSPGIKYSWRVYAVTDKGRESAGWGEMKSVEKATREEQYAWAIRMAETVRGLYPTPERVGQWNYTEGMVMEALVAIGERTGREKDIEFAKAFADRFVQADGTVTWGNGVAFDVALHSLDRIRPAGLVLKLYERTKEEKYKKAAGFLAGLLDQQPKTSDGGYWHRQTYPNQMWLDGVYMADVFSAKYGVAMKESKYVDEACKQILLIAKHTRDEKTGLFYHGWDETKSRPWANKETGVSPEFWGRAMGWYGMAMADVLGMLPADHPQRGDVMRVFKGFCEAVVKVQDKETGMWWQILDKPGAAKNYVETSCSLMFSYALAKGARQGWIGAENMEVARRGMRGVLNKMVDVKADGRVDLRGTVQVGSLGGNGGNYDYYVGVPVVTNDQKSIGAMMYLSLLMSEAAAGSKQEGGDFAAKRRLLAKPPNAC